MNPGYQHPMILEARGLTSVFGPKTALDRVSFAVRQGAIFGLVGPNGSGKSTLVRALCGLRAPTSGTARVMNFEVPRDAALVRQSVGYMSQKFSLYADLTCRENIDFFATMHGLVDASRQPRIDEVVDKLKLRPYLDRPAGVLSGGWKQRLALATTILHRPPLMFLDEPTAGIDPVARRELWDELANLAAEGATIFVTTQYMDEIERCTEVAYIYLSKLIVSGTPAALKRYVMQSDPDVRYVDIETSNVIHSVQWLRTQPFCVSATSFGASIHALLRNSVSGDQIRRMWPTGPHDFVIRTIEPTLEDVFVMLTERATKARAKQQGAV